MYEHATGFYRPNYLRITMTKPLEFQWKFLRFIITTITLQFNHYDLLS